MLRVYKVFLATAYPQSELVRTMKRLLACLALCATLSASAQDDNCTVLGVQELSMAYQDLNASIDSITSSLEALTESLALALANSNQVQVEAIEEEFESALFSSDSTSAIVEMGNLSWWECQATCKSLGKEWSMISDIGLSIHWDSLGVVPSTPSIWLRSAPHTGPRYALLSSSLESYFGRVNGSDGRISTQYHCVCEVEVLQD